jgi:vacuolar-type H+-ATPase subunit F/Vma7
MKKNKILMIVSHFYPFGSIVEAKNNYLTLLELEKNGFEVDVCTFSSSDSYPVNVKYLVSKKNKLLSNKNIYYNFLRKKMNFALMPLEFSYLNDFLNICRDINLNNYDYLYTVFGNGHEHIVGMELKKEYCHLKHIAEFRDPWVHNEIAKKYFYDHNLKFYADIQWNKLKKIEQELVSQIDLLLVESNMHGEKIKKDFNYQKDILFCNGFSNLFNEEIVELDIAFKNKPVIGFIGYTYYGYDDVSELFIEVLEELEREGLEFTFISVGDNHFAKLASSCTLNNFYAFQKVSYPKALAFMKTIDIGLALILESYAHNINSKIFEYMQNKKFILAIAPKDGEMDRILQENNRGMVLSYQKESMKKELRALLSNRKNFKLNDSQINKYNRSLVFQSIVKAIKNL